MKGGAVFRLSNFAESGKLFTRLLSGVFAFRSVGTFSARSGKRDPFAFATVVDQSVANGFSLFPSLLYCANSASSGGNKK